ncbi:hypothetical protein BT93_B1494 [Corymbia citriodora subsp. variegata]|nr:hypothetical protein BT93_B1494 [Corymbia citriodora subsp. variegata]
MYYLMTGRPICAAENTSGRVFACVCCANFFLTCVLHVRQSSSTKISSVALQLMSKLAYRLLIQFQPLVIQWQLCT